MDVQWDLLIDDLGPPLYRYFNADPLCSPDASDCVQETFFRLAGKIESSDYSPASGSLRQYAFGIARLIRLETRRKRFKIDLHPLPEDYDSRAQPPDEIPHGEKDEARLKAAIQALPEPLPEIFLLLIDRELGLQEIADLLTIPLGTVKSHIHRGKKQLKEVLT